MSLKIKWAKFTLCHANEMSIFKKWAKFTHCMSHADAIPLMSTCHLSPPSINHLLQLTRMDVKSY